MTYTATRHYRSTYGPHDCPDATRYAPHSLIRDRKSDGAPTGLWVCPIELDAEVSAALQAQIEAEEAAERAEVNRAEAARIGRDTARDMLTADAEIRNRAEDNAFTFDGTVDSRYLIGAAVQIGALSGDLVLEMLTAAALAGLEAQR